MAGKPKGGTRPGSGRKSKAQELGLRFLLDKCWTPEDREKTVRKLSALAKAGEIQAIKLLFEYAFGKPSEKSVILSLTPNDLSGLTDEQLDALIARHCR